MSEKPKTKGNITLLDDKFTVIDDMARYIINKGKLYIEIELPANLKDVATEDNISTSGKTYRVYSNGTNRKFIKNSGFDKLQIQINSYLSVKDSQNL